MVAYIPQHRGYMARGRCLEKAAGCHLVPLPQQTQPLGTRPSHWHTRVQRSAVTHRLLYQPNVLRSTLGNSSNLNRPSLSKDLANPHKEQFLVLFDIQKWSLAKDSWCRQCCLWRYRKGSMPVPSLSGSRYAQMKGCWRASALILTVLREEPFPQMLFRDDSASHDLFFLVCLDFSD